MPAITAASSQTETPRVLRVGLIGAGISASRSPMMHVAAGQALGLDLRYDLIDTDTADWQDQPLEACPTSIGKVWFTKMLPSLRRSRLFEPWFWR